MSVLYRHGFYFRKLQLTWDAAKQATKDTEMRARITGVAAQMEKFEYFFGLELGRKLLTICLGHFKHQECLHVKVKRLSGHQLRLYNQCEVKRISEVC